MRRIFSSVKSPPMAVAFVALLAALTGSAVALPGKNTVDSGDIKNSAVRTQDIRNSTVRTQDIRNSTVRGSDVRNNTLTGSDVDEGSLGTVPNAAASRLANRATAADRAGSAGSADTVRISRVVTASDGSFDVPVVQGNGWRVELDCDLGGDGAVLMLENTGAGNDSAVTNDEDYSDVDQGEEVQIVLEEVTPPEGAAWAAMGGNGRFTTGSAATFTDPPTGFGGADCVGASTLIG